MYSPDFSDSELIYANFQSANFAKGGQFNFAHISNTDFSHAQLRGSKFIGAVLIDVSFRNVNIGKVKFNYAYLSNVDFSRITNSINSLDYENWKGAIFDEHTKLPFPLHDAIKNGMIFCKNGNLRWKNASELNINFSDFYYRPLDKENLTLAYCKS